MRPRVTFIQPAMRSRFDVQSSGVRTLPGSSYAPVIEPRRSPGTPVSEFIAKGPLATQEFDLDIGIIYTYERDLIGPLLSTLKASADGLRVRLILIDNASAEGVDAWRRILPETLVLRNSKRLSYSVNMNRILAASTSAFTLMMNTDMFFDPRQQCLTRMVEFMRSHPDCGVAGCRLMHADGQNARAARRFQNFPIVAARRFGLGRIMRGTVARYLYADRDPLSSFECEWLSGCFLMLRRKAVEQVGLFDESFGKYFEDCDMCLRMAKGGWRVMYHGMTSCYHLERRASRNLLSIDACLHLRAYFYWLGKWGYLSRAAMPWLAIPSHAI